MLVNNWDLISLFGYTALDTQEDEEDKKEDERHSKSRSINYIVRRPGTGVAGGLLQWGQKERSKTKRKDGEEEERSERCNF